MTTCIMGERVHLRKMKSDDIAAAHALSRLVKWPHRVDDWEMLFRLGMGVVAEADGEMVGTIMAWPFGDKSASLGMVIVRPDRQGLGIGRRLMNEILDRLGSRTIFLNSTTEGLALYESFGFSAFGVIRQHQGAAFSVPFTHLGAEMRIRPAGQSDAPALQALDSKASGLDRGQAINDLLRSCQGVVLDRGGELVGYSLFRRFGLGYSIGPTIAPDDERARALIFHWLGANPGIFCRLDVPDDEELSAVLTDLGLPCVGAVTRMARGPRPEEDPSARVYSIISQALG